MTTTQVPTLRPRGLGELLDQAIRLYRRHFLTFIGIIAIVQIPLTLLQLIVSFFAFSDTFARLENMGNTPTGDPFEALLTPGYFGGVALGILLAIVSWILIQGVATAALTRTVADSYLGEPVSIIEAYRKVGKQWLPLLGALLLAALLSILLAVWLIIPCVGWFTGIGILIFYGLAVTPLIPAIIVLEKQPASRSIRRAWDLVRRRFWWVLGFTFILTIFAQLIITGPVTLLSFIFQFTLGANPGGFISGQFMVQTIVQSLVQLLFSLIYIPLQLTAITLMYFDLRIRTEGFDLDLLAEAEADTPTVAAEMMAQAPDAEQGGLITWTEMGYFVAISVVAIVLYFIVIALFAGLSMALVAGFSGM